jgi:hypothetical protein
MFNFFLLFNHATMLRKDFGLFVNAHHFYLVFLSSGICYNQLILKANANSFVTESGNFTVTPS